MACSTQSALCRTGLCSAPTSYVNYAVIGSNRVVDMSANCQSPINWCIHNVQIVRLQWFDCALSRGDKSPEQTFILGWARLKSYMHQRWIKSPCEWHGLWRHISPCRMRPWPSATRFPTWTKPPLRTSARSTGACVSVIPVGGTSHTPSETNSKLSPLASAEH